MKHSCERISCLASVQLERPLSFSEKLAMKFHFLMCSACRNYSHNMLKLHDIFALERVRNSGSLFLPTQKRKRIRKVLHQVVDD